jgi:phage repressor protein C with HTH and peptisase S24 domain
MIIPHRVRDRMSELGLSQSELARRMKVSQTTVAKIASGRSQGSRHLHLLARELHTTPGYLVGETDDDGPQVPSLPVDTTIARLGIVMVRDFEADFALGPGALLDDEEIAFRTVPFPKAWLGMAAGRPDDLFIIKGEGDSMFPTIVSGDDVLVDGSRRELDRQDAIWAIGYGELGMVKRVRRLPGGAFQLNSDNPAVRPIEATGDEFRIFGRVIWVGRRV